MKIEYGQESQPELTDKSRNRFADEINRLRLLGFIELCHYTESLSRFSLITLFPIFLMTKINREIVRVESPLRIVITQPLLAQHEYGTYALVFGMGVKFYTVFTDGTGLISANFESNPIQDMQMRLYKYAGKRTIEECWQAHQKEIGNLQQLGRRVDDRLRFENYVSISNREEQTE